MRHHLDTDPAVHVYFTLWGCGLDWYGHVFEHVRSKTCNPVLSMKLPRLPQSIRLLPSKPISIIFYPLPCHIYAFFHARPATLVFWGDSNCFHLFSKHVQVLFFFFLFVLFLFIVLLCFLFFLFVLSLFWFCFVFLFCFVLFLFLFFSFFVFCFCFCFFLSLFFVMFLFLFLFFSFFVFCYVFVFAFFIFFLMFLFYAF